MVCYHPRREEIEAAVAAGGSGRDVAARFGGTNYRSISRHCAMHLDGRRTPATGAAPPPPDALVPSAVLPDPPDGVLGRLDAVARMLEEDVRAATSGRERAQVGDSAIKGLRNIAELTGELRRGGETATMELHEHPDFRALLGRFVDFSERHPELLDELIEVFGSEPRR